MNTQIDLSPYSTAEMIATIMTSAMTSRTYHGMFGVVWTAPMEGKGTFKVELADSRGTYLVRREGSMWTVTSFADRTMVGQSTDIEEAARHVTQVPEMVRWLSECDRDTIEEMIDKMDRRGRIDPTTRNKLLTHFNLPL